MIKKLFLIGFIISVITTNTICSVAKTKVACIGDSITYGKGITDQESNSYPKRLGNMLGSNYEVKNFGLCNATVETGTIVPYTESKEYKDAKKYNADIYVVMLGTNDAKSERFKGDRKFKNDYVHILNELKGKKIIMMDIPPVNYSSDVVLTPEYTTPENVIKINRLIEDVAKTQKVRLIKNNKKIDSVKNDVIIDDGVHLNNLGAIILAKSVYDSILT